MGNLKKVIILLVIIIIAIIICLVLVLNPKVEDAKTIEYESQINIELNNELALVTNKREFIAISNKISLYLQEENNVIRQITYSGFLSGAGEKKVDASLNRLRDGEYYIADKMYYIEKSFDFSVYYACGIARKIDEEIVEERNIYNIVLLDHENMTFAIIPSEEFKEEKDIYNRLIQYKEEKIEKNEYNSIQFSEVTDESMSRKYFSNYKLNMLYNVEKAYQMLDKEYRDKRFGDIENYKSYINENKESINKMTIQKIKFNKKNGYNEYIIIDNNYNYYFFRETAIMKYTVIGDNHTIDSEEFTQKYKSSGEVQKVGMNIEKIMDALNSKDYDYIYSKLADSYKNNNFPSFDSFKEYAVNMFFGVNSIEYIEHEKEGEYYLYKVIFKDNKGESLIRIEKTIIMQLKDNNDFIFSFNLDNDGLIDENPD